MEDTKRKDVITALEPVISFSKCIGFLDFSVKGNPHSRVIEFSNCTYFSTLIVLSAVFAGVITRLCNYTPTEHLTLALYPYAESIFFAVCAIIHKIHSGKEMKVTAKFLYFETQLRHMEIDMEPCFSLLKKNAIIAGYLQVPLLLVSTCHGFAAGSETLTKKIISVLALNYLWSVKIYITSRFSGQFNIIKHMFQQINSNMEDKIIRGFKGNIVPSNLIRKTAILHQELNKFSKTVNKTQSLQMLILFAGTFLGFTTTLFFLLKNILNGAVSSFLVAEFLATTLIMMNIIYCVHVAHECTNCVSILMSFLLLAFASMLYTIIF